MAHLLIEEAVLAYRVALIEKRDRDADAWQQAEQQLAEVHA